MSNWVGQGAWVWVKWKPGGPKDAWKAWNNRLIRHGWSTTGEWDCKLWVASDKPEEVQSLIWDTIRKNEWVEATRTEWAWQWT